MYFCDEHRGITRYYEVASHPYVKNISLGRWSMIY